MIQWGLHGGQYGGWWGVNHKPHRHVNPFIPIEGTRTYMYASPKVGCQGGACPMSVYVLCGVSAAHNWE